MHAGLSWVPGVLGLLDLAALDMIGDWLTTTGVSILKVVIGFSLIIFVHELGHFLAAKWVGIRVDRFAVGFWYRLFGWRRGEGFTFGERPEYSPEELQRKGYGETDYCFKALPLGGYVKMLGQDDIQINDDTGEISLSDDPRAFQNRPVGARMIVISAGVIFNLIFAIFAFAAVFMLGKREQAPQLGFVQADSPAAVAGLRPGDTVLAINGDEVSSFRDVILGLLLADDGVARFRVERQGEPLPDELVLHLPEDMSNPLAAGVGPAQTTELAMSPAAAGEQLDLAPGDRIVEIAGRPVANAVDWATTFMNLAAEADMRSVPITVERAAVGAEPAKTETLAAPVRLTILRGTTDEGLREDPAILGFYPRQMVGYVAPGSPAEKAGFQPGDVVVQWGERLNPLYTEIVANIDASAGRPIPVLVRRDGAAVELTVTPQRPFRFFSQASPRVGIAFEPEEAAPIVADVRPETPAAQLGLPRGARLSSIAGQPVADWFDVVRLLKTHAGETVVVQFSQAGVESTGRMAIPSSIVNELNLPPTAQILSINDRRRTVLEDEQVARMSSYAAIQATLRQHAGETVRIKYQPSLDDPAVREASFTVAPDAGNADPWQMRVRAMPPRLQFEPETTIIQTLNPLHALQMGLSRTGMVLFEVYQVLKRIGQNLVERDTSTVQHVAGPVGIINAAVQRAEQGFPDLLFFLAYLSVNLAVINFLPFPVVDGGHMVFLIIEKIKGSPLGVKTQMVATLIGLATILLVFLLVTIKDITRIWGG